LPKTIYVIWNILRKIGTVFNCFNGELVEVVLEVAQQGFGDREFSHADAADVHLLAHEIQPLLDGLGLLLGMLLLVGKFEELLQLLDEQG
jgi:hypothetical protein